MAHQDSASKSGNGEIKAGPSTKKGPGPELMGASTLVGNDVYNRQGDHLGGIKEIMLDMRDGRVAYAVLTFTAFFSTGAKLFAVPWSALALDTTNKRFALDVQKDRLKDAPGFDKNIWPDMADQGWQDEVHGYYKSVLPPPQ